MAGADGNGSRRRARLIERVRIAGSDSWARIWFAAALVGAVLAAAGGFGTTAMTLLPRFFYWECLVLAGAALGRLVARRVIPRTWFLERSVLAAGLTTLVIGLPMTFLVAATSAWVVGRPFHWARIWDVAPSTLGTTAGMTILALLVRRPEPMATHLAPEGAPPPRFLARLPQRLADADLWAVEAQDHYLRVHTSRGEDLILMRLADALVELDGLEGARTHRSWWVGRNAVIDVERGDGRATLTLQGGLTAPVSRAYAKALREAGWF